MSWVIENWAIVSLVLALGVALLKHFGKAKIARIAEVLIDQVESDNNLVTKRAIQRTALRKGLEPALHKLVKKITE
jgi:hypothetical protein